MANEDGETSSPPDAGNLFDKSKEIRDVESDEGKGLERFPVRALPPSMRVKVTGVIVLYLCTVCLATNHSQELVGSTVMTVAWQVQDLVSTLESILIREVLVFETSFSSWYIDRDGYDWRDLAARIEEAEGVSRVSFGGPIQTHYAKGSEISPTEEDICVFFNYASLRQRFRGVSIEASWGRTIHGPDEVVISQSTADRFRKEIGDEIEFFDTNFRIVGISMADTKSEGRSYPCIMVDFSHLDKVVAYLRKVAERRGIPQEQSWFSAHFSLEVYARGEKDVDRAVESLIDLQGELSGKEKETTGET